MPMIFFVFRSSAYMKKNQGLTSFPGSDSEKTLAVATSPSTSAHPRRRQTTLSAKTVRLKAMAGSHPIERRAAVGASSPRVVGDPTRCGAAALDAKSWLDEKVARTAAP